MVRSIAAVAAIVLAAGGPAFAQSPREDRVSAASGFAASLAAPARAIGQAARSARDAVSARAPLLGERLSIGKLWPHAFPSGRLADWQTRLYGIEDTAAYRVADNAVFRVDPVTSAIESLVALVTGAEFRPGAPVPDGFDVYNVPSLYRARFPDSAEAQYRYADGRIYAIDPRTRRVAGAFDLTT